MVPVGHPRRRDVTWEMETFFVQCIHRFRCTARASRLSGLTAQLWHIGFLPPSSVYCLIYPFFVSGFLFRDRVSATSAPEIELLASQRYCRCGRWRGSTLYLIESYFWSSVGHFFPNGKLAWYCIFGSLWYRPILHANGFFPSLHLPWSKGQFRLHMVGYLPKTSSALSFTSCWWAGFVALGGKGERDGGNNVTLETRGWSSPIGNGCDGAGPM